MFCVKYGEKCKEKGEKSFLLQFLFTKVDTSTSRQGPRQKIDNLSKNDRF